MRAIDGDWLKHWIQSKCNPYGKPTIEYEYGKMVMDMIDRMHTIQSERKQGHWVDTGSGQECSVCQDIQYGYDTYRHYCPCCGAKMEMEDE